MKLNGLAKSSILSLEVGAFNTGYDIYDPFDLQPQNLCSFNTGSGTTNQVLALDFGVNVTMDFVAILNHNLNTAAGSVRVAASATPITTAGGGTEATIDFAVLNAAIGGGTVIEPAADGDTLYTFGAKTARYWSVEFADIATWTATDLTVGAIMVGAKHSLPLSPDINIGHGFDFSGVNISTGTSGKKHSNPSWIKANNTSATGTNYIPFRSGVGASQLPGREYYSLAYSIIADTSLLPSDLGAPSGSSFSVKVMSKTGWSACPMVMGVDSTSTTAGDYLFCRLIGNSFNMTQSSAQMHNIAFAVEQEF